MPFLVRWPVRVPPGVSDALVCHVVFPASFAALTGRMFPAATGPDNVDTLPALLGEAKAGRDHLIKQASALSVRQRPWKYIEPGNVPKLNKNTNTEMGNDPQPQQYDLATDPAERTNLAAREPGKPADFQALLQRVRAEGAPSR